MFCSGIYLAEAQITFEETYGNPNEEKAISVQQTSDNGYIIDGVEIIVTQFP